MENLKKNPLSLQLNVEDFAPASNDEKKSLVVMRESVNFWKDGLRRLRKNKIATLTGGRCAEKLIFHSISTGASNDIEQATKLARAMVTKYGMSEEFGMVAFETETNAYLGGDSTLSCSPQTAKSIDDMVVAIVKNAYKNAEELLSANMDKLHKIAKYLYEQETITGEEFMKLLEEKEES